jgi:hypothetical protein
VKVPEQMLQHCPGLEEIGARNGPGVSVKEFPRMRLSRAKLRRELPCQGLP